MRKLLSLLFLIVLISCVDAGTTTTKLIGDEKKLPPELKGLKVYKVFLQGSDVVNVAVLNNKINSLSYNGDDDDDDKRSVVILENTKGESRVIHYTEILSETNEYILIKK